jgi:hypothetical protein
VTANKHDHDDDSKNNHLQSAGAVTMIYESLTGKRWTKADQKAYEQISHLPPEQVEQLMRTIHARASEPIGSFAFFVTGIQKELAGAGKAGRAALRKKYERWIGEIRELHVGDRDYKTSDLIDDLKWRCSRDGVTWDDDVVNELLGL